ncbi:hypothetical protein ACVA51_10995 [Pseudomonas luteola]
MSEELKPCPFCGGKVDPTGWLTGYGETGPECEECGATAPTLEIWNNSRMAELEAELAEALTAIRRYNEQFRYIADGGGFYLSTAAEGARLSHSFLARHGDKS